MSRRDFARRGRPLAAALLGLAIALAVRAEESPARASQVDAYFARPRILVMTDIANEPDDQTPLARARHPSVPN